MILPMQSADSVQVTLRFFDALRRLKALRVIRGKKSFTDRYGINRWNLNSLEKSPERDLLQLSWLTFLVRDYGVSADWLLTGSGSFLSSGSEPSGEPKPANDLQG